jgi:hypothetical protein
MQTKTHHVQIRVTASEKAALKRLASRSGLDVSSYVLGRALPSQRLRFEKILGALVEATDPSVDLRRFALAELNDFLTALAPGEFADAVADADVRSLDSFVANYLAALVEQTAASHSVAPPSWTKTIEPLDEPYFAGGLKSLRPHLLRKAPVPFKRRNLFVDSSLGNRV